MDKKLRSYQNFIAAEISKFDKELKDSDSKTETDAIHKKIKKLNNYHQKVVRDFQHERLIHLIVTFFFAGVLLMSIVTQFLLASMPISYDYDLLSHLILIICAALFITEFFYVRHYYQLENGTQKLYDFSKRLYELSTK
jgi:hypothetical protein